MFARAASATGRARRSSSSWSTCHLRRCAGVVGPRRDDPCGGDRGCCCGSARSARKAPRARRDRRPRPDAARRPRPRSVRPARVAPAGPGRRRVADDRAPRRLATCSSCRERRAEPRWPHSGGSASRAPRPSDEGGRDDRDDTDPDELEKDAPFADELRKHELVKERETARTTACGDGGTRSRTRVCTIGPRARRPRARALPGRQAAVTAGHGACARATRPGRCATRRCATRQRATRQAEPCAGAASPAPCRAGRARLGHDGEHGLLAVLVASGAAVFASALRRHAGPRHLGVRHCASSRQSCWRRRSRSRSLSAPRRSLT